MAVSTSLVLGARSWCRRVQRPTFQAFRALSGSLTATSTSTSISPCPQAAFSPSSLMAGGVTVTHQRMLEDRVLQPQLLLPSLHVHRGIKPAIRDPERPKRPMTAWFRFLQHFRVTNPDVTGLLVLKTASVKWQEMSDTEKNPWVEEYKKAKAEFDVEFKKYVESGKKESWESPPGKPKKPKSAFFFFLSKVRADSPHLKATEISKSGGDIWKGMNDLQKAPYEQQAAAAKLQYAADLKAYKASGQEEAWKEKTGIKAIEDKKKAAAEKREAEKAKKKAQLALKRERAAKKKEAAAEKKKKAAERKKLAAEKKKKLAQEKKQKAAEKKKKLAEETKQKAAEKKQLAQEAAALAKQKKAALIKKASPAAAAPAAGQA